MGRLSIKGYDIVAKGEQEVGFESTRSDNSDPIEYHAFMSLEGAYLIEKIDRTVNTNVVYSYYFILIKSSAIWSQQRRTIGPNRVGHLVPTVRTISPNRGHHFEHPFCRPFTQLSLN